MVERPVVVRRLSPNVKVMWLMPQMVLVTIMWFLGTTFGLFLGLDGNFPIVQGIPNPISIFLVLVGVSSLVLIPSYIWASIEHNAYTYQLDSNEIVIRYGIINRHRTVIPFDKIQDVKTDRDLLERVLGLVTLRIETAGRSKESLETASISGISINEREDLIGDIMASVVVKRGEVTEKKVSQDSKVFQYVLMNVIKELRDISVNLKEEIRELNEKIDRKSRNKRK